jgi:hypothetical protein
MAHARRKFFEAQSENPKAVALILRIIAWLYECEARWDENQLSLQKRQEHRRRHYARPLYWLHKVALGLRERVLPKSGLGKACDYLLAHWKPLTAHLNHGQTRLDNNLIENAIRPSAIGKNYGKSSIMRSGIGAGRCRRSSASLRGTGLSLHNYTASRKASSRGYSVRRRLGGGDGASSDRNTLAFMSRSASM